MCTFSSARWSKDNNIHLPPLIYSESTESKNPTDISCCYVKVTKNLTDAINHINKYNSNHTDSIITENKNIADQFFSKVDSAILMHNVSTQFADGGEFGMGAEIGIGTGKLHARGPIGANELTSFKYIVEGNGIIRK